MTDYVINYRNGGSNSSITITPGSSPNLAGLNLMGQNYANYGQNLNQNWVSIAENFASNSSIANPVTGQLWYTSANLKINIGTQLSPNWQNVIVATSGANITVDTATANDFIGNSLTISNGPLSVINGNIDVSGNINVTGNLNYSNVSSLVIGDPLIYLGANNTGDVVDLGIVASYNDGTYVHTGVARDAATNYWTFYDGVLAEPTTTVDWANATYPTVKLGNLIATNTISVTGNANVGNIGANNAVFNTVTGSITTNAQPNITSTGTLTSLTVSGNISAGNVSGGNSVSASFVTGTLTTATQPNITSVGTLTSLAVSGALTTTNITSGSSGVPGTITGNWSLTSGSRLEATYADLAEYYSADREIEPGTVVDFDGSAEVTVSTKDMSTKVAGVVTTNPAYVMNRELESEFKACLALQGRVPCKVVGYIHKGDMLVSAGNGYARAEAEPVLGSVIGKALENKEVAGAGIIEIAVSRC